KMLEPGLSFIIWPVEVPHRPISTRIVIDEGVTLGGRSADGIPFAFSWAVWYQLTPQNIPADRLAATVALLLQDTHKVLNNLVGYTLRRLITQKTAVEMAKNEGFQILDRFFRPYLRRETEEEGFLIHR